VNNFRPQAKQFKILILSKHKIRYFESAIQVFPNFHVPKAAYNSKHNMKTLSSSMLESKLSRGVRERALLYFMKAKGGHGMETKCNYEKPEDSVATGIVIGIIDILAMIIVITILCTANFRL
jgi:hypothetical protein